MRCHLILPSLVLVVAGCDHPSNSTTTSAASSSAAPSATTMASAPAASSAAMASPPPAPSPADPQDAKLGAWEKDVATAIVNAATGKPVDPKWVAKDPAQALGKLTDPDDKGHLDTLGKDLTIVAVEMELGELAQPSPEERHELNGRAIMLQDGTIRWGTAGVRQGKTELSEPTPGLDKSAPVVVDAGKRMMKALETDCKLPWLAPQNLPGVPADVQEDFVTNMTETKEACTEAAKVKAEWRTHIDDVRVLVKGNGHYGYLSSVFDVEQPGDRLVLSPLHVEVLDQKTPKK